MKNNHSLACLGAIEAGPQDTEQLFNDWVSEVETFDERLFWQKKMYRWTGEEVGPSWSPSCPFRQRGWIKTQNRKIWKMCNPRAGLHCASSLDSHYQIAHIQGDEINVIFSDVENKAPILRVNDAASIASMVCFLIKKILDNFMWKSQPFSCFPWALNLQGKQTVVGQLHPFLLPSHSCCFCCWMLL